MGGWHFGQQVGKWTVLTGLKRAVELWCSAGGYTFFVVGALAANPIVFNLTSGFDDECLATNVELAVGKVL